MIEALRGAGVLLESVIGADLALLSSFRRFIGKDLPTGSVIGDGGILFAH